MILKRINTKNNSKRAICISDTPRIRAAQLGAIVSTKNKEERGVNQMEIHVGHATDNIAQHSKAIQDVLARVKDETIIDMRKMDDKPIKIAGIAALENGDVVALFTRASFTLNTIIVQGERAYLTPMCSTSIMVNARRKSLEDAIEEYNDMILHAVANMMMESCNARILVYRMIGDNDDEQV